MTKEQVREWAQAVADAMWPENLDVGWTDEDSEFYGRFATLVRNAALEEAAEYLEGVHQSRLVKFAEAIRNLKEPTP